jgi:hypothetical protein
MNKYAVSCLNQACQLTAYRTHEASSMFYAARLISKIIHDVQPQMLQF